MTSVVPVGPRYPSTRLARYHHHQPHSLKLVGYVLAVWLVSEEIRCLPTESAQVLTLKFQRRKLLRATQLPSPMDEGKARNLHHTRKAPASPQRAASAGRTFRAHEQALAPKHARQRAKFDLLQLSRNSLGESNVEKVRSIAAPTLLNGGLHKSCARCIRRGELYSATSLQRAGFSFEQNHMMVPEECNSRTKSSAAAPNFIAICLFAAAADSASGRGSRLCCPCCGAPSRRANARRSNSWAKSKFAAPNLPKFSRWKCCSFEKRKIAIVLSALHLQGPPQ